MGTFSKTSLEQLRSRIDLVEVLNPYLKLQRSGASYKALCPFHEERTPSFVIQKGDNHYHCFGCGAHGDAIQFLMTHLKMSFVEAVEYLADRFHVELEEVSSLAPKGPSKTVLKEALIKACQFYQFHLLHTLEGHTALDYLYSRGICLDFIREFQIGLAPKRSHFLEVMWEQKISNAILEEVGLLKGGKEFFSNRITIPIQDPMGFVVGFSARKYKADTFGGKYVNTPETVLFKKSKTLFGLNFSRKTIAKTGKVLIVEGQIDALRLIYSGFDWTVAGQGTAFGEEMVKQLVHLGAKTAFLALDGDAAGLEAAIKIGNFFQKEGIEAFVVKLPEKSDPDLILQEKGPEIWQKKLDEAIDYLSFLVGIYSHRINPNSPAGKNELVTSIARQIREWDHPLMVHESLRKLALLTNTPEAIVAKTEPESPDVHFKRSLSVTFNDVDPDRILEADLLRWLFLMGESCPELVLIAELNLEPKHFRLLSARKLFEKYLEATRQKTSRDLLTLAIDLEQAEQQLFLAEVLQKRVNRERASQCFIETVQRILDRSWMQEREEIKVQIFSGTCSEKQVLELAKQFDRIKREPPKVKLPFK